MAPRLSTETRIHQHLIIESKDRVVKHRRVKSDAQIWRSEDRPVPGESITNPSREPFADTFFVAPRADLHAFGVAEGDPYPDAILAFLLDFLSPRRMRLGQMESGIDEDVDTERFSS
jgi:hypothetical protein